MNRVVLIPVLLLVLVPGAVAQKGEPDIGKYVNQINEGQVQHVREQLPALLSKYPNHPGALYVQALLTREGAEAVRIYQSIVDNFPRSEWADDAVYKTYQFYYSLGLYRTAELKMNQLKAQYPTSPYLQESVEPSVPLQSGNEQPVSTVPQQQIPQEPRQEAEKPVVQAEPIHVRFSLQVGAFTVQANAEAQKSRFEHLGYTAELISKVKDTRSLFTVLVGDYQTYSEAKTAGVEIKRKLGIDSIVISR
jgi:cell division septation protein DedD